MKKASEKLGGGDYTEFTELITSLYLDNMKRVRDDVEWFIISLTINMQMHLGKMLRTHLYAQR